MALENTHRTSPLRIPTLAEDPKGGLTRSDWSIGIGRAGCVRFCGRFGGGLPQGRVRFVIDRFPTRRLSVAPFFWGARSSPLHRLLGKTEQGGAFLGRPGLVHERIEGGLTFAGGEGFELGQFTGPACGDNFVRGLDILGEGFESLERVKDSRQVLLGFLEGFFARIVLFSQLDGVTNLVELVCGFGELIHGLLEILDEIPPARLRGQRIRIVHDPPMQGPHRRRGRIVHQRFFDASDVSEE